MAEQMSNVIKLALNLPALERLIGDDSELEIKLREQVVNEFTKRHLKSLVETATIQKTTQELQNALQQEIQEKIGTVTRKYGTTDIILAPDFAELLRSKIESFVKDYVDKLDIKTKIEQEIEKKKNYLLSHMTAKVEKSIDIEIEKRIQDGIRERLVAASKL